MENILITIYVFLFGLVFGSFLNVVIYRVPRKEVDFWKSRSICPNCNSQLKWYHNIPLFSFLFLRGKCGFCSQKISIRYPLVELLNGLGWLYFFIQYSISAEFFIYAVVTSALIVIFFIDLDFQIIPDGITLPGIVVGLAVSFLPSGMGIVSALIGMAVGGGSLYLVAMLGDFLFKKESMGGGDIKMAAMLGAFLGWQKILFIFIASAFIGVVVSLVMMYFSSKLRESRMVPFGPFLALAAMVAICYGNQIISFYTTNFLIIK